MVGLPSLLLILPALHGAAPDKVQVATGALSCFASMRCNDPPKEGATAIEWPGLVYARATPPTWGVKSFSQCSGADTHVLTESLAAGTLWATGDREAIAATPNETLFEPSKTRPAFKAAFGWELPDVEKLGSNGVYRYEARRLKQLFDRLSFKPTDQVGSITAQQLYDLMLKNRVTRFARDVAFIKANVPKAKLAKLLKEYRAAIQDKGAAFDGPAYLREVALTALPQDQEPESARNGQTLGTMLRRIGDGTWPTVVTILKKVLADYDPELFKELGKKL